MAAYAGTSTIIFSVNVGNKRMTLLKVDITNYNGTGIPLIPQNAAMGVIEAVIPCSVEGNLDDLTAPFTVVYDRTNARCKCYSSAGSEVPDDTNISTNFGYVMLLIIGA